MVALTGLERAEASELYARLRVQANDARAEADRLAKMVRGLENILQGLADLYPDLQSTQVAAERGDELISVTAEVVPPSSRPNLSSVEIVARVVRETSGGVALSVPDVFMEMEDRGWLPDAEDPLAAVRTALARARNQGLIHAVKLDGRSNGYLPQRPTNASAPVAPGAEDQGESVSDSSREEGGGRDESSTPLEDHDGGVHRTPDHLGLPGDRASVGG